MIPGTPVPHTKSRKIKFPVQKYPQKHTSYQVSRFTIYLMPAGYIWWCDGYNELLHTPHPLVLLSSSLAGGASNPHAARLTCTEYVQSTKKWLKGQSKALWQQ